MAELLLKKKNQDTLFIKINNKIIDKMAKYKFPKYKDNLSGDEKFIYSYNTPNMKLPMLVLLHLNRHGKRCRQKTLENLDQSLCLNDVSS